MPDISHTLIAKSDQLNAADLARPVVITVRSVRVVDEEQPVCVDYGENRPPWKPCKGMRRLLAQVWGTDTDTWIGHRVELFNDNGATWAGKAVGGIRVSAISGIDRGMSYNMRTSKKSHTMYKIAAMEKAQPPRLVESSWPTRPIGASRKRRSWPFLLTMDRSLMICLLPTCVHLRRISTQLRRTPPGNRERSTGCGSR